MSKEDIMPKGWKRPFAYIGKICYIIPLFWGVMLVIHVFFNLGQPFFNKDFYRRTAYWGIILSCYMLFYLFAVLPLLIISS